MKRAFTILLSLSASLVSAQYSELPQPKSQAKTTTTQWRISAYADYKPLGNPAQLTLVDSAEYLYAEARGSEFDYLELDVNKTGIDGQIDFDTAYTYEIITNSANREFLYYDSNRRIEFIRQRRTSGNNYKNAYRNEAQYNSNGNVISKMFHAWHLAKNIWDTSDNIYGNIYTYDSSGRMLVDSGYDILGGHKRATYKKYYMYNGNTVDELVLTIASNNQLDTSHRISTTYIGGRPVASMRTDYFQTGWENKSLDSFEYNSMGMLSRHILQKWDNVSNTWRNFELDGRTFNSSDMPVSSVRMRWDGGSNTWDSAYAKDVYYDSAMNPERVEYYAYQNGMKEAMPFDIEYYYWSAYNVSVPHIKRELSLKIYPNPASGALHIVQEGGKIESVTIMDMTGQVVYTAWLSGNYHMAPVSGLPAGNYIVSVGNSNQQTSKLITIY